MRNLIFNKVSFHGNSFPKDLVMKAFLSRFSEAQDLYRLVCHLEGIKYVQFVFYNATFNTGIY